MVDLRSDTFTVPTAEMREVIASAAVGDDVWGEDPSVNELQDYTANFFGKEAALFVPSGTMGNQLGLKVNTQEGDEVIIENEAHIYYYETSAPSLLSRVQLRPLISSKGEIPIEDIEGAIRPDIYYYPNSSLICLESSHNRHGGTILSLDYIKEVRKIADKNGMRMHLDGARVWNSIAALNINPADYVADFDTISVCLSKGMGAPVGSLLIGRKSDIDKALKWRKILGGGMRQTGIIAAAGTYAIKNNFEKLVEDHKNAKEFGSMLSSSSYFECDLNTIETNIVAFKVKSDLSDDELLSKFEKAGVKLVPLSNKKFRAVFHLQITNEQTQTAANTLINCLKNDK